jgi:predicted O-methyltransferase YrrM
MKDDLPPEFAGADVSSKTIKLTNNLYRYFKETSLREPEILQRLRLETRRCTSDPDMQISPEQGQFMQLLTRLISPRKVLEVGVFTGYSSLSVALALPPEGKLIACDRSEEWTSIARKYWTEAGVAHKIDLRLGPALQTLEALLSDGEAGSFDFAFVDADKKNLPLYYERILELLRPGGLIGIDNVLWSGRVTDSRVKDRDTVTIRRLNKQVHEDSRIWLSMLPIGDGFTLALKK